MAIESSAKFVQGNTRITENLRVSVSGQEHPQLQSVPQPPPAANEPYYNMISEYKQPPGAGYTAGTATDLFHDTEPTVSVLSKPQN
jgi:hypothetical protein